MVTLGCPKNDVDSETVAGLLKRQGFDIVSTTREADLILINTCGFIESAREESMEAMRDALKEKKARGCAVYVWGCFAGMQMESLRKAFPETDGFFGIEPFDSLPARLTGGRLHPKEEPQLSRLLSTPPHTAYLKIAEGCDHLCTFCTIPLFKGKYRSRTPDSLVREAEMLAGRGVRELTLIAQDTTAYGGDLGVGITLAHLLRRLAGVEGILWIRVMYTHPAHVTDEILDAIAGEEKVCPYIDMPLQHIADPILKAMGRGMTRKDVEKKVRRIREIPGMAIRTAFIVGFPGETESQFQDLLDYVQEVRFERMGAFVFSPEPGTHAFGLKKRISAGTAQERFHRLMETQQRIMREENRRRIAHILPVIVDGFDAKKKMAYGRSRYDALDVDQTVWIRGKAVPGTIIPVTITGSAAYDLVGKCP